VLLLDTHLVLWAAFEPGRLSPKARTLLENRAEPLAFSLATIWELAIKTSLQRPGFAVDVPRLHAGLLDEGFAELALKPPHLFRAAKLPWLHRDPFDRLLVAQAIEEGAQLLTADAALKAYGRFVKLV
jgi:PIN domain nuclease of toxin-antitoxin system